MLIVSPNLKLPSEVVEVNEVMVGAVESEAKAVETVHSVPAILVNVPSVSLSVELLKIVPVLGSLNL